MPVLSCYQRLLIDDFRLQCKGFPLCNSHTVIFQCLQAYAFVCTFTEFGLVIRSLASQTFFTYGEKMVTVDSRNVIHLRKSECHMTFFRVQRLEICNAITELEHVESEIEYRPPSIIGRVYKICALLGQLLLAPKCSPKSQNLVEK